jgi:signal transduction histidine kinase/AraC-like DNA-binding protein
MNVSEIYLSKLLVNNQSFELQKPKSINSQYLPAVNRIELNHTQNSISLAFVANNFIKNSKSKFRYRLLNYIDEWNETDYNSNVSFTKIPPGDYVLQIEYLNNDRLSMAPLKEINIEIYPPFWFTWYAYSFYFLLVLTIVVLAVRELRFREKSRAEHILFTEKVKFFTNVSHEFRTPLTLIISPINNLMKKYASQSETFDSLKIIQRNADRLLRLTNQILDFRLIEINNVKLKREKVDLITLCKNVYECFEFQINEKEINCIFNSSFKTFELYVDTEKIEKVIYNILSNALKYSDDKGQIIISIERKTLDSNSYTKVFSTGNEFIGDVLEIKIKDNGKGIKKNILSNIFDRFFVDAENTATGTGIGLHICQEYMKLHNGNIMVESEPSKETIFTINIPIESEASFEKENVILQSFFDNTSEKNIGEEFDHHSKAKPVILFAEDNNELRAYYKNLLSAKYKVISAKNGTQAFEIATELVPNLIISDILMPGMDGMLLTEQIRKTPELSHIPIILLTALSDNKFKIESMQKGANTFLTKPVEEDLLFAKIESILSNAELLRNKYKGQTGSSADTHGINQPFIEKVEKIIEKNLQNQSFEITELASQMGVSRSSLQRKIKKTANMSPSEFIREVRLKKAVKLIKSDEYNIDEIAIIVGFNSTSYFIRSFKKKYEMTPTAFKQNVEKSAKPT